VVQRRQGGLSADIATLALTLLTLGVQVIHATTIELAADVKLILARCAVLAEAAPRAATHEPYGMLDECGNDDKVPRATTTRQMWQ